MPVAFSLIFIGVVIGVYFIGKITTQGMKAVALNMPNKLAGAGFSLLKYGLIISIILNLVQSFDKNEWVINEDLREESFLYQPLTGFSPAVVPTIQNSDLFEFLRKEFKESIDEFDDSKPGLKNALKD